jgi:YHS domain-containing protein
MRNFLLFVFGTLSLISIQLHAGESLKIVPNDRVCMVTDMVFPKAQIPVTQNGKTYYGCCQNCKKTLSEDPSVRTAKDPMSGKPVDKATAVIAAREDGSVMYFENKKSFEDFSAKSKKQN